MTTLVFNGYSMSSVTPKRGWEEGYVTYRPVLLRALGALAKRGFAVSFDDGIDLIHEFFLSQWEAVSVNYDHAKGPFGPYIYKAFIQFARPRIVKLRRWQSQLTSPELMMALPLRHSIDESTVVSELDLKIWQELINKLPDRDRNLLTNYLTIFGGSERNMARSLGLSRYVVRESILIILGQLIINYRNPELTNIDDWKVAQAVWGQCRTIQETANLLRISPERVRRANNRNVEFLAGVLRRFRGERKGDGTMSDMEAEVQTTVSSGASLLYKVLTSPGDRELLAQLRQQSQEILALIDQQDIAFPNLTLSTADDDWVAEVYEALAYTVVSPADDAEEERLKTLLFQTSVADLRSIGSAFNETLLPGLPLDLVRFSRWFEDVKSAPEEHILQLYGRPDVQAAFPTSVQLVTYGVTPADFYFATEAIAALVDRMMRHDAIGKGQVILPNDHLTMERMEDEVVRMSEVQQEAAQVVCRWLFRAAEYKPHLFAGFECNPTQWGVSLQRADTSPNLYQRWSLVKDQTEVAVACV